MHYKQSNKESRTYVQGLRPFGNTLPRGLKGILKKNGYNYSEIISKWNMLVGKDIAQYAYPKSIKMKKRDSNGMLVLAIKRGDEIITAGGIYCKVSRVIDENKIEAQISNNVKIVIAKPTITSVINNSSNANDK